MKPTLRCLFSIVVQAQKSTILAATLRFFDFLMCKVYPSETTSSIVKFRYHRNQIIYTLVMQMFTLSKNYHFQFSLIPSNRFLPVSSQQHIIPTAQMSLFQQFYSLSITTDSSFCIRTNYGAIYSVVPTKSFETCYPKQYAYPKSQILTYPLIIDIFTLLRITFYSLRSACTIFLSCKYLTPSKT